MKVVIPGRKQTTLYAFRIADDDFGLSRLLVAAAGGRYRPMARFSSKEELEIEVNRRGCVVEWQQG